MTTRNHTPVATGAAANASVINAPLGQLDATLGDLTALTTTAKTDLVVAINELDSVKQDAATAQAINLVNASPASGSAGVPGYRALVTNDLPASGVSAGTYAKVVVDAKGRVTSGSAQIGTADISDIASYPLDTLGAATDNTNKDASITAHGLLPKLANDVTKVLTGLGTWVKWAMGVKYNSSGAYTPRAFINFLGAGVSVTDDAANDCVKVTISGIAGGTQALAVLTDCELTSPVNNNVLTYDQSTALWKNQNISSFVPTGHVIQEEGSVLTNRPSLNFKGLGVTASDNAGTNTTDITVSGTAGEIATFIHAATDKTTPIDADEVGIWNSVDSALNRLTWANLKATLKAYLDTLYTPLTSPVLYERDIVWAGSVTTVTTPNKLWVNVNDKLRILAAQTTLALGTAASWDTVAGTDYRTASDRAGKDFYIYACDDNVLAPTLKLSVNSTTPTGYNAATSRKIGGFHCLCVDVGAIAGHSLTNYVAGDILPASVWDLKHRPRNQKPEGMVWSAKANFWVDIYLMSGTGTSTLSVNGGTISDTRNWMDFVDDAAAVGKRLLRDYEFQVVAQGITEGVNIHTSADPGTTGGHIDTNHVRMISNIGCEDLAGVMWQWLDDQSFQYASTTSFGWLDQTGGKGQLSLQGGTADVKLLAGGSWVDGAHCGSRGRYAASYRWAASTSIGGRAGVEPE